MKKIISSVLISSILATSISGCASKKPENVSFLGQDTYYENSFNIPTEPNIKVINDGSLNGNKSYIIFNDDGSEIKVMKESYSKYSNIEKTSKLYDDFTSCITDFNVENKKITDFIEKADKTKKEDGNTFVYYGKSKLKLETNPCLSPFQNKYSFKFKISGMDDYELEHSISKFRENATLVFIAPFAIVAFIIMAPIAIIASCIASCGRD